MLLSEHGSVLLVYKVTAPRGFLQEVGDANRRGRGHSAVRYRYLTLHPPS